MLLILAEEKYRPKTMKFLETFRETISNTKKGIKFSRTHNTTKYLILASIFMAMMIVDGDYWHCNPKPHFIWNYKFPEDLEDLTLSDMNSLLKKGKKMKPG